MVEIFYFSELKEWNNLAHKGRCDHDLEPFSMTRLVRVICSMFNYINQSIRNLMKQSRDKNDFFLWNEAADKYADK